MKKEFFVLISFICTSSQNSLSLFMYGVYLNSTQMYILLIRNFSLNERSDLIILLEFQKKIIQVLI